MTRHRRLIGLALGVLFLTAGCYRTTVRSGLPPGNVAPKHDDKWHSGLLVGLAEASGPYALPDLCPHGWAEIDTSTNLLQGLVSVASSGIYTPQSVTIVCAAEGAPAPAPRDGYPKAPAPAAVSYPPAPVSTGYPPPPPEPDEF